MKTKLYFFILFVGLISLMQASEQTFEITYETLSISEIQSSSKYKKLDHFTPGHHKTIIRLANGISMTKVIELL